MQNLVRDKCVISASLVRGKCVIIDPFTASAQARKLTNNPYYG